MTMNTTENDNGTHTFVNVTEGTERLIARLRTPEGMDQTKAYICDAFDATVRLIEDAGRYDRDAFTPLLAIARYCGLLGELAEGGGDSDNNKISFK